MTKTFFQLVFISALGLSSCMPFKKITSNNAIEQKDFLVYLIDINPDQRQMVFYDPVSNTHTQILTDWNIQEFSLNKNYQLAFSSSKDGQSQVYILDYPFTKNTPTEIPLDISAENTPISWSPDGH